MLLPDRAPPKRGTGLVPGNPTRPGNATPTMASRQRYEGQFNRNATNSKAIYTDPNKKVPFP
jgi:hypothetical protein